MFTLTGTLKDHAHRPLVGIRLTITPSPSRTVDASGQFVRFGGREAITDDKGQFSIDLATAPGLGYTVRWSVVSGRFSSVRFVAPPDDATIDLFDITPTPAPSPMAEYVRGASAYEMWLSVGNAGTVDDYLEAIKGEPGPAGQSAEVAFEQAMETHIMSPTPHPQYDDLQSLELLFQNRLV